MFWLFTVLTFKNNFNSLHIKYPPKSFESNFWGILHILAQSLFRLKVNRNNICYSKTILKIRCAVSIQSSEEELL